MRHKVKANPRLKTFLSYLIYILLYFNFSTGESDFKMKDQREKLKKYIEYWNDHNSSHLEKLNSRIELAIELGIDDVVKKMRDAVDFMNKANESLLEAFKLL